MKIGIFGGCFNPPHKMHKEIADELINKGYVDKVIFVPTGNGYSKAELVDIDKRIQMLNLMVDNNNTLVSDISKYLEYQYTFEILDYFKSQYPNDEIYFICGTDNLKEFSTWKKHKYILQKYKLLVVIRGKDNINEILCGYSEYKDRIIVANIKQSGISSTIIRRCVKEEKIEELNEYLEQNVLKYIQEKSLYKD